MGVSWPGRVGGAAAGVGLCASEGRTAVAEAQTAQGSQWEGNGMAGGAVLRTF